MIATQQQVVLSVDLVIGHLSFGTLPILGFEILNLNFLSNYYLISKFEIGKSSVPSH